MDPNFVPAFVDYIRSIAVWRESRFNDDLRDGRNLVSANGLFELIDFVRGLPGDDPRLERLAQLCLHGERFEPGQQVHYEVGRFRFFTADASIDGFLTRLVELAEADSSERGHFGGPQIPGDDPWERDDE